MKFVSKLVTKVPLFCKVIYIVSTVLYLLGLFIPGIPLKLCNYPHRVEVDGQIYRLFFPFFSKGYSVLSILSLVIDFLWIRFFFTKIEKSCSTVFFTVEILIQNLTLQLVFSFFAVIFIHAGILSGETISFGWSPLIVIMAFKKVYAQGQALSTHYKLFCFNIPKQYIPYIIGALSLIYSYQQLFCMIVAIAMGFIQFAILGKHFIRLPISFYLALENLLPESITKRQDYIKVRNVQNDIIDECCEFRGSDRESQSTASNKSRHEKSSSQKEKGKRARKTASKSVNNGKAPVNFELNEQLPNNPSTGPMPETPTGTNEELQA